MFDRDGFLPSTPAAGKLAFPRSSRRPNEEPHDWAERTKAPTARGESGATRRCIRDVEADAAWRRAVAYGRKKAKALGVRTDDELEDTINDIVNDYRHGAA